MLGAFVSVCSVTAPWCYGQYDKLHQAALDVGVLKVFAEQRRLQDETDAEYDRHTALEAAAAMREHVRFVAAFRQDPVDQILGHYDSLVQYWPCKPSPAVPECRAPSEAARLALSVRYTHTGGR